MYVAVDGAAAGLVAVADTLKDNSIAAAAMGLSSVTVVTNALRLRKFRFTM